MKYYLFLEDGKINGCGQAMILNPTVENIEVTEEIFNKYIEDPDYYVINSKGKVVKNPKYNQVKEEKRRNDFNERFFPTSLGYVRRDVTMKNGVVKDFLTDIMSSLAEGMPILTYAEPDFTKDITDEVLVSLQSMVRVTNAFLDECRNQFAIDFYGFNPLAVKEEAEEVVEEQEEAEEEPVDNIEE